MKHPEDSQVAPETLALYERLKRGEGRQEVHEGNVAILMKLAGRDGHTVLEEELREWKAN
jgi:hypothetical protein